MRIIIGIMVAFLLLVITAGADVTICREYQRTTKGRVIAKAYKPSSSYTTYSHTTNGQQFYTTVNEPEELKFIVAYDNTSKEIKVDHETFGKYKDGDTVNVDVYQGKILGIISEKIW